MLTLQQLNLARERVLELLNNAQVPVTAAEADKIEVTDFGLRDFCRFGLQQLDYVDSDVFYAGEIVMLPNQICPEHHHPTVENEMPKEQTFRCRWGTVYLYVPGEETPEPKAIIPPERAQYFTVRHEIVLRPGQQYTIPPNTLHWFQAGPEGAVITEFSTGSRRAAEVFTDPGIYKVAQMVTQGLKIVLLGAPGSGKGTQSRLLSTKYGTVHLSMGNMLREEVAKGSRIGSRVAVMMSKGEMVPDSVVFGILDEKLTMYNSYILDGFPRTLSQAEYLDKRLSELNTEVDVVFLLELPLEEIIERLSGRRVCSKCSRTYHVRFYQSDTCNCGGKLVQRADDNPEAVRRRVEVYNQEIGPLREFYSRQGKLWEIDGSKGMELSFGDISRILDEKILPEKRKRAEKPN